MFLVGIRKKERSWRTSLLQGLSLVHLPLNLEIQFAIERDFWAGATSSNVPRNVANCSLLRRLFVPQRRSEFIKVLSGICSNEN